MAVALPNDLFQVSLAILGQATSAELEQLKQTGTAHALVPVRHSLDVRGRRGLRRFFHELHPDILHTWGAYAACMASSTRCRGDMASAARFVVSQAAQTGGGLGGWLAARQIRRADRVIPQTRADGERYRRLGVTAEQLTLIGPAAVTLSHESNRETIYQECGVPTSARLVVSAGPSEGRVGPRDAIIAFDMLRYDAKDLYLLIQGAGTEEAALERFGRSLAFDDFRVRFLQCTSRGPSVINLGAVVLATSPRSAVDVALAAMAAGKPVVGWATADLAEIVEDKVSGLLVPVGDRTGLAAAVRSLLDNPAYARRIGEAGRTRASERFSMSRMVEQYTRLYLELAGGTGMN